MKHNPIYLRNKLSEKELFLLKKDLIDHSIQTASKIKNLNLAKEKIEEVVKNSVDRILLTYQFGKGGSLGELVRMQVMTDLRSEYEKVYPEKTSKVIWPDLTEKKPFDKLLEALQEVKLLSKDAIDAIFEEMNQNLNGRQSRILSTIYNTPLITYAEVSKQFGVRGVMTYREIKIIYTQLMQTLRFLEIEI
jgi:hypothetical protein